MFGFLEATLDTSIVSEIVSLGKTCMGLFTEFPINIFMYAGLVAIGFRIFKKAKGSVG